MKLKKTLAVLLAGMMLVGGAASVSAGAPVYTDKGENVLTYDSIRYPYYYYNCGSYYPYWGNPYCGDYENGYFYNWIYDCAPNLKDYWNPVTGRYDTCSCLYCTGHADLSGYYWVNGVQYCAKDYYIHYAPHTVTAAIVPTETSKETGITKYESSIPSSVIKKSKTDETSTDSNVIITDSGVTVKNPAILGAYNRYQTVCGTYYAYDKVDLSKYFNQNTLGMSLILGEVQTFGTGFKMISSDSNVVKIYNDTNGQNMKAVGMGSADVYLYTAGGVPFMKISVSVTNAIYGGLHNGYIDVQIGSWRLDKTGDSTSVVVKVDEAHKNDAVKLAVVQGDGYIKDGMLYATGDGAIVLKAYSTKNPNIQGYAIVYVGKYVDALYDGYWTSNGGNISCNYWNPNLWGGGYKINGWVLTDNGSYLPVISKIETTTEKPNGDKVTTTTTVYSDVYDLLYGSCYGNVDTLYALLWKNGKLNGSSGSLYQAALQEILEDIAADLASQYN